MKIMIQIESSRLSESIRRLLVNNGCDDVVVKGKSPFKAFTPDILVVDITTLTNDLLAAYPRAKVFLINDADVKVEKLCDTLLSYNVNKALRPYEGLQQVWIDSGSVRALAQRRETASEKENKMNGVTGSSKIVAEKVVKD